MLFTPIKPMLASSGEEAFDDDNYIFEPKWDGWRILLHKQGNRIEAYTRSGRLVTGKFPELRQALPMIRSHTAILDCEGIVMRDGQANFDDFSYRGRLSNSIKISSAQQTHPVTFVAFDVLYSGKDHRDEPLAQRKQRLRDIITDSPVLTQTMYVEGQGRALFALIKDRQMEGMVAKKKSSIYRLDTRTADWLKIKYFKPIDVIILGYRTSPHFALVIGLNFRTIKNKPVGVVESGFISADKQAFLEVVNHKDIPDEQRIYWLEPRLCCRIEYLERSDTHQLLTTEFKHFLFDKSPQDCVWR